MRAPALALSGIEANRKVWQPYQCTGVYALLSCTSVFRSAAITFSHFEAVLGLTLARRTTSSKLVCGLRLTTARTRCSAVLHRLPDCPCVRCLLRTGWGVSGGSRRLPDRADRFVPFFEPLAALAAVWGIRRLSSPSCRFEASTDAGWARAGNSTSRRGDAGEGGRCPGARIAA